MKSRKILLVTILAILGVLIIVGGASVGIKYFEHKQMEVKMELLEKREAWIKYHEVDIKNYILSGLSEEDRSKVLNIKIDTDNWNNIFDEGAAGFGATNEYKYTIINYDVVSDDSKLVGGSFTLGINISTKNGNDIPQNAKDNGVISNVLFDKVTSDNKGLENIWETPKSFKSQTNLIGGALDNG